MPLRRSSFLFLLLITFSCVQTFQILQNARFRRGDIVSLSAATATTKTTTAPTSTTHSIDVMPMLDEWRVLPNGSVQGRVLNHPDIADWSVISTSPLVVGGGTVALSRDGIVVETSSGSKYRLLNPRRDMTLIDDRTVEVQMDGEELSRLQKLMKNVKQRGLRGAISYTGWELGFWTVSLPLCIVAFRQITGHWPDIANEADLELLGAEAFLKFNADRFAFPLRIGLAFGTSKWSQENIVDRFSTKRNKDIRQ